MISRKHLVDSIATEAAESAERGAQAQRERADRLEAALRDALDVLALISLASRDNMGPSHIILASAGARAHEAAKRARAALAAQPTEPVAVFERRTDPVTGEPTYHLRPEQPAQEGRCEATEDAATLARERDEARLRCKTLEAALREIETRLNGGLSCGIGPETGMPLNLREREIITGILKMVRAALAAQPAQEVPRG